MLLQMENIQQQPFERQREALLRIEQQVRDLVGPDPLFPQNVKDNATDLEALLRKRFFLLGWMLKASPEEYERMRLVNRLLFDKTVQLRDAMERTSKRLREMPKDDFVDDIEVYGNLSYCFNGEQSVLPMECDDEYGSDYRLMMSVNDSLQDVRGMYGGKDVEFYNLDDGASWGHKFGPAPHFDGICVCHTASVFVDQLGYPVFDLLRMNDFWSEIHIVFQNFDYIKKRSL